LVSVFADNWLDSFRFPLHFLNESGHTLEQLRTFGKISTVDQNVLPAQDIVDLQLLKSFSLLGVVPFFLFQLVLLLLDGLLQPAILFLELHQTTMKLEACVDRWPPLVPHIDELPEGRGLEVVVTSQRLSSSML
jgi:hypothetical protein